MYHLATALFFGLVLVGALAFAHHMVREYWDEILAALKGEMPARPSHRSWTGSRVRVSARPRPVVAQAGRLPLRAAS